MNLDLIFYRELEKTLGDMQEKIAAELVNGKCTSFEDYKNRTGRIRGIADALKSAKEIQQRLLGIEERETNA